MTNVNTVKVEVRSIHNDMPVIQFETVESPTTSVISEGWSRLCNMIKSDRVQAETRYYVTKA